MSAPALVEHLVRTDGARLPSRRLSGLAWLVWRQHRFAAGLLVAVMLLATGWLWYQHSVLLEGLHRLQQAGCGTLEHSSPSCWSLSAAPEEARVGFLGAFQPLMLLVPALLGMFLGAPLLAQEFERGTHRLAWSQSVTRGRWLAARLGAALALVLVTSAVLSGLTSWFWQFLADRYADHHSYPPFRPASYAVMGIVPIATALFAFAVGVTAGMLLRRTLAAVAATGVLVAATEIGLYWLRPFLYPQVYAVQPIAPDSFSFGEPLNAWLVSSGEIMPDGTRIPAYAVCPGPKGCMGARESFGYYHPVSHFWPLQLVESGLLLGLAGALLAFVFLRLRRAR